MASLFEINRKGLWLGGLYLALFSVMFKSMIVEELANEESISLAKERLTLENFPERLGDWKAGEDIGIDIRSLDVLRLTSYVKRTYTNSEGKRVFLYLGYWASQSGEHQSAKHSPTLCLPSNGWLTSNLSNLDYTFKHEDKNTDLSIRRIIGEKRGQSTLFYYWFFAGSEYYNQEWYALIKLSLQNLLYGRNDGGIVEIAADIPRTLSREDGQKEAEQNLQAFLGALTPYLHKKITEANRIMD